MSKIRAHAEDDFALDAILIRLAHTRRDGEVTPASGVTNGQIEYAAGVAPGSLFDPVLRITHDEAHAIYDASGSPSIVPIRTRTRGVPTCWRNGQGWTG